MSNNSFSSGPQSRSTFNRSNSIVDEEYETPEGAPSYPTGGMNSFPHQEYQYGPREVLSGPDESYDAAGSLSDMRPIQASTNNMKDRNSVVLGPIGEAPEFDGVVHVNGSLTNGIGGNQYSDVTNAPGHSKLGHENHSNPSGGEASSADGEINEEDYIGISLVGKKFKEVNPTAYYVEKDDDLNQFM